MNNESKLLIGTIVLIGIFVILMGQQSSLSHLGRENQNLHNQLSQQSNLVLILREELATLRNQSVVRPLAGMNEEAENSYNFQGLPAGQIFAIYEGLCGKKLVVDPNVNRGATIRLITKHKVTASAAMLLIQEALNDQVHAKIVSVDAGILAVVPMHSVNGPIPIPPP